MMQETDKGTACGEIEALREELRRMQERLDRQDRKIRRMEEAKRSAQESQEELLAKLAALNEAITSMRTDATAVRAAVFRLLDQLEEAVPPGPIARCGNLIYVKFPK